jgi:hypothetical protein
MRYSVALTSGESNPGLPPALPFYSKQKELKTSSTKEADIGHTPQQDDLDEV